MRGKDLSEARGGCAVLLAFHCTPLPSPNSFSLTVTVLFKNHFQMDASEGIPKLNGQEATFSQAVVCGKKQSPRKIHLYQGSPIFLLPAAQCPQGQSLTPGN